MENVPVKFLQHREKILLLVIGCIFLAAGVIRHFYLQQEAAADKLMVPMVVPAAGNTENSLLLTWFWTKERPEPPGIVDYRIYINDWQAGSWKEWQYGPCGAAKMAHSQGPKTWSPSVRYQCTLTGLEDYTYYMIGIEPVLANGKTLPKHIIEAGTLSAGPKVTALDYGLLGRGETDDTEMLQRLINICPPGGAVVLGRGLYRSGPLRLHGQMTLRLQDGARLEALPRNTANPAAVLPSLPALLNGEGGHVIRIEGPGQICGAGYPLLRFKGTKNLCLQDVKWLQTTTAGSGTEKDLQFLDCREVVLNGVTAVGLTKDGLDFSGSRSVLLASSILP